MSAERYYTEITPVFPAEDGTPRYSMYTQSYPEEVWKTEEQLRKELTREGRFYQPIKWAARTGAAIGIIYYLVGVTGHPLPGFASEFTAKQEATGVIVWAVSEFTLALFGNTLSSWESKKQAFDKIFPKGKIDLIPEKFSPMNLLRRVNPLQLLHKGR